MKSTYRIVNEAFPADPAKDILAREKTVIVKITNEDGNIRYERFGLVTPYDIFAKIDVKEEINLNRCFINGFSLDEYRKQKELKRDECVVLQDVYAVDSWWEGVNKLSYATFNGDADFYSATFSGFVFFRHTIFCDGANFSEGTFNNTTYFTSAIFENTAHFKSTTFTGSVKFNLSTFKDVADFYSATFSRTAKFQSTKFNDDANFNAATFSEDADFASAIFSRIADFTTATFRGDVYFNPSVEYKTCVQFARHVSFDSVHFEKSARYEAVVVKEIISFKNAHFKGAALFDSADIASAIFTNTYFQYPVNLIHSKIDELDLTGTVFASYAVFNHWKINSTGDRARETYRTIKHELIKINNRLDSVEYQRKEMEAYHNELKKAGRFKHILEKFVLFCNRVSNNYGTNLGQAICFTLIVAGVFFTLHVNLGLRNTYFQWGCHSWEGFFGAFSQSVEYFVQFMFIGHNFDFMGKNHALNWMGYIFDSMGRIAIGYAYFQIYQALRKFKIT